MNMLICQADTVLALSIAVSLQIVTSSVPRAAYCYL
jgi:hypothetical protein